MVNLKFSNKLIGNFKVKQEINGNFKVQQEVNGNLRCKMYFLFQSQWTTDGNGTEDA